MKKLKKIIFLAPLIILLNNCANDQIVAPTQTIAPTPPKKKIVKKLITNPNLTPIKDVRIITDMDEIGFEWDMVNDPNVAGYYIFRSTTGKEPYKLYKTLNNKYTTHFVDLNVKPNATYYYKFATFDKAKNPSYTIKKDATTLETLKKIDLIFPINGLPKTTKFIFRPHPNPRVEGYYIYKFNKHTLNWDKVATLKGRLQAEYSEQNLKNGEEYKYKIVAYSFNNIVSKPSDIITVKTKPLPPAPINVKATLNLAKQITISWLPPKSNDIYFYKIYRAKNINGPYEFIASTKDTFYKDTLEGIKNKDNVIRYYKVTMVDKSGLESKIPSYGVVGKTLPKPQPPLFSIDEVEPDHIALTLISQDNRAAKYMVIKSLYKDGKLINKNYINLETNVFIDSQINPNFTYEYSFYEIDKNGLISKPTKYYFNPKAK